MVSTAAGALSSLVSLLLSFILPISMFTSTINPGETATITSTLTVQEESYGVETVFYRTEENALNMSFAAIENGEKEGIAFKDGELSLIRGEGSSTVEEYIFRMKRAVENGLASPADLSDYEELLALQPVLSYLTSGHLKEDMDVLLPWIKGKMPAVEQLLSVRTTSLEGYRTQYNFTVHLRDLPAAAFNLVLRSLASSSFRSMVNNLHVWDLMEYAPSNPADYLLLAVGDTKLGLDELPALTLPIEMVIAADGTLESFNMETVYYEDYSYVEIEVNYADGHLQAAIRPYSQTNRNTAQYVSIGLLELSASAKENGGSVDLYFSADDSSLHFFANYQLMHGRLWSADAQFTLADYDSCTGTLTYRPNNLIVTLYGENEVVTGDLRWVHAGQSLSYWLDASVVDPYYVDAYMIAVKGTADWRNELNHTMQLNISELESPETIAAAFTQRLTNEGNAYTHDVTGTVTVSSQLSERTETIPVNWNTVITLK